MQTRTVFTFIVHYYCGWYLY